MQCSATEWVLVSEYILHARSMFGRNQTLGLMWVGFWAQREFVSDDIHNKVITSPYVNENVSAAISSEVTLSAFNLDIKRSVAYKGKLIVISKTCFHSTAFLNHFQFGLIFLLVYAISLRYQIPGMNVPLDAPKLFSVNILPKDLVFSAI